MKKFVTVAVGVVCVLLLALPLVNEQHNLRDAIVWSRLDYGDAVSPQLHGFPLHPDHQGAGHYVRARMQENDLVIAVDAQQQTFYTGRVDYRLVDPAKAGRFCFRDGDRWKDIYTNATILDGVEELRDLFGDDSRRAWIITSGELVEPSVDVLPPGVSQQLERWESHVVFVGRDGVTRVFVN